MLTFSPFNIIFLICPSQSNFILTFSPSTLRFLSVLRNGVFHPYFQPLNKFLIRQGPCREISSLLSAPQHYISYQSLATEYFILTFSPSRLRFLSVPHKRISCSLLANLTSHFLSVPHKEFHPSFHPLQARLQLRLVCLNIPILYFLPVPC